MKKNFTWHVTVAMLLMATLFVQCNSSAKNENNAPKKEKDPNKRQTDLIGANEYEFNMLKNPVTGQIPEGIRELELQQAREIAATQRDITVANTYIFQGPENLGGRTRALAYDVRFNGTTNRIIMAGGVSNGIFKSTDDGATWTRKSPIGDLFNVSALAQDPRAGFEDTWYYGGGEFTGNSTSATGASYRGKGIYKSTDNGETWTLLPASNTGTLESFDHRLDYIVKIIVNPVNGNVYAAGMDAIYRSTDGGTTWGIVLTSGSAGFGTGMPTDIIVTSGGRFYAAFAGTNNVIPVDMPGVWSSTTGASGSWTKIAGSGSGTSPAGWNANGTYGRVVLALAPSLESRVFALYWNGISYSCGSPAPEAELYRWDDGISTWTDLSANMPDEAGCLAGNDPFAVQGGYDLVVAVKPDDPDAVFIGGTNVYRSTSGFTTTAATTRVGGYVSAASYGLYAGSHPDIHCIVFQPGSSTTMLCGNDGGIQRTTANLAATVAWTPINTGYRTYQYYYVTLDPRSGNDKVLGGAQDNGSTRNIGGSGTSFELAFGGDGVSVGLSDDISGTTYEYVGSQLGNINRRTSLTALGSSTGITPTGESGSGLFVTLFHLDMDNSQRLYYANDNALYRTTSASTVTTGTWTSLTGVATSVGAANDITALATTRGTYSAATSSLFMGASNGGLYRLDDPTGVAAATAPVTITGGSFPAGGYISSIAVNPRNDDTIMVTFSNYSVSSIWWTGNANSATPTWTAVEGNISLPSIRSSAIMANGATVEYYVGTSVGLYSTTTIAGVGTTWTQEGATTVGNAVVSSLALRPADRKLLVGTHGHGMWSATIPLVVPVSFISFNGRAERNSNELEWRVANENNCSRYEIEKRDAASGNFIKVGTVNCAGASNPIYRFTDNRADLGATSTIYRIKQVDLDNHSAYSSLVTIRRTVPAKWVEYVSLAQRQLFLRMNEEDANEQVSLRVLDMSGKELMNKKIPRISQSVTLPASLQRGVYNVVLTSAKSGASPHRVLVQ